MDLLDDRKQHNRQQLIGLARWCAIVFAAPAVVVAVLVFVLTRSPILTALAALVIYGAVAAWALLSVRAYPTSLLSDPNLNAADEQEHARLHNLTEGLCIAHGLTKPALYVMAGAGLNACTVAAMERDNKQSALVVTTGLVDSLHRIELEGVLAQQLAHIRDGDTALSTLVAAVAALPGLGPLLARRAGSALDPHGEQLADLAAAGMTRYPPGLAAALERLLGQDTTVAGVEPEAAHLWLADPLRPTGSGSGSGSGQPFVAHPPLTDRILVLREL